ncbi:MAG: 2-C-methyl-D-erythritol 2,4-cyclodiphosphate synthase [Ignavibacteriales bacterium]|nr:2-C-methyl-D-erythritol 2,4-cyclodiphosphate synthase [Ignavibacteriales bacterium]
MKTKHRIGFGFDVHRFAENRKFILGGIEIPFEKGLLGHSDADVLIHAICDALLGALALGDIGQLFPDADVQYKNIDSKILLEKVYNLIMEKKYQIENIDSTVVLEKPKLAPYIIQMREKLKSILKIDVEQISIKATTSENLGFTGRAEGVCAFATVLLKKES